MIDIDKLDKLPFREAIHNRFIARNNENCNLRNRYRTERISNKEWKIASDTIKHNVGKSIDHAYSNFCYKSIGYNKDFFWIRLRTHEYWNCNNYDIVAGVIVTSKPHWRRKHKQVKSEYLNPKLVQARAEKKQQEKRNLRFKKLVQKNKPYNFRTQEQIQIDNLANKFKDIYISKLADFTVAIVRTNKPDIFGIVRDHIEVVCFPDKMLKQGYFMQFTNGLLSGMQKCVLIKTLQ